MVSWSMLLPFGTSTADSSTCRCDANSFKLLRRLLISFSSAWIFSRCDWSVLVSWLISVEWTSTWSEHWSSLAASSFNLFLISRHDSATVLSSSCNLFLNESINSKMKSFFKIEFGRDGFGDPTWVGLGLMRISIINLLKIVTGEGRVGLWTSTENFVKGESVVEFGWWYCDFCYFKWLNI